MYKRQTLYSLENQEALGYLVMYVETAYFDAVFEDVSFSEEDFLFVTDSAGKIIIGQCPKGWEIPQEEMINGTVHSIELDGEERQICSASVAYTHLDRHFFYLGGRVYGRLCE